MITSYNFGPVNVSSLVIIHNIKAIYVLITPRVEFLFLGMLCSMNSFSLSNSQSLSPYTSCPYSLITIPIFSSSTNHISLSISNFTPIPSSFFSSLPSFSSISLFVPPFDPPTTTTSLSPPSQPSTSSNPLVKDLHISLEKTRPPTHNDHPLVTRSNNGIYKPSYFWALLQDLRLNHLLTTKSSNMVNGNRLCKMNMMLWLRTWLGTWFLLLLMVKSLATSGYIS